MSNELYRTLSLLAAWGVFILTGVLVILTAAMLVSG
jgi:hypothetical protein